MIGFGNAGTYRAQCRLPFLGDKVRWAVNLNNHTDVALFDTQGEASIDAARRNYERGSYPRPEMIGL